MRTSMATTLGWVTVLATLMGAGSARADELPGVASLASVGLQPLPARLLPGLLPVAPLIRPTLPPLIRPSVAPFFGNLDYGREFYGLLVVGAGAGVLVVGILGTPPGCDLNKEGNSCKAMMGAGYSIGALVLTGGILMLALPAKKRPPPPPSAQPVPTLPPTLPPPPTLPE